jgi:hypothetical protein
MHHYTSPMHIHCGYRKQLHIKKTIALVVIEKHIHHHIRSYWSLSKARLYPYWSLSKSIYTITYGPTGRYRKHDYTPTGRYRKAYTPSHTVLLVVIDKTICTYWWLSIGIYTSTGRYRNQPYALI